jgi:hypothetical protein
MPWREVARVMSDLPHDAPDDVFAQEAARLRKRFQLIKDRLRRLGQERGLI